MEKTIEFPHSDQVPFQLFDLRLQGGNDIPCCRKGADIPFFFLEKISATRRDQIVAKIVVCSVSHGSCIEGGHAIPKEMLVKIFQEFSAEIVNAEFVFQGVDGEIVFIELFQNTLSSHYIMYRVCGLPLQAWIEGVPNAFSEQVVRQNGDQDGNSREEREPPGEFQVILAGGEDVAPTGGGGLDSDAEK